MRAYPADTDLDVYFITVSHTVTKTLRLLFTRVTSVVKHQLRIKIIHIKFYYLECGGVEILSV